jgi:hypothetical protein
METVKTILSGLAAVALMVGGGALVARVIGRIFLPRWRSR